MSFTDKRCNVFLLEEKTEKKNTTGSLTFTINPLGLYKRAMLHVYDVLIGLD